MKRNFEEDDEEEKAGLIKAKILVTVVPFVLIIIILAVTLALNSRKKETDKTSNLQQSIMDYADENKESDSSGPREPVNSDSVVTKEEEQESPTEAPKETNSPTPLKTAEPTANKMDNKPETEEEAAGVPGATPAKRAAKKDYSKIEFHKEEQLKDMMAYWADNNQKALDDLVFLDHYIAMSFSLGKTDNFYYYGETDGSGAPNGKGIAVYADNQYYYGDWKNGERSGNGTWIHYHMHLTDDRADDLYAYHQYTGSWAKDLPEGEGSEHFDYDMSLLKGNDGFTTNLIGTYSAGLIHGEFYLTSIYVDGRYEEWKGEASKGAWIYQSESKDKKGNRTILVNVNDPDAYTWMHPKDNQNIGVCCLKSKS